MLIDTHAHLYWESFQNDFDEVVQRAVDAGVSAIINVGVDVEKSKEALRQTQRLNRIYGERSRTITFYSTIGIHPHEAIKYSQLGQTYNGRDINVRKNLAKDQDLRKNCHAEFISASKDIEQDIKQLEELYLSDSAKVVAVGECGLDFFFGNNPGYTESSISINEQKNLQRKLLKAQIALAKKLNLPLIIHCRDDRSENPENDECWEAVIEMTKDHFGIYHCYSGLPNTTYKILNTNFLVAFAANITYPKNEYLREAVKLIPLNRIVLETDSPFLSPQSKRGQRNEPSSVKEIARLISDLKGISLKEVSKQTTKNAVSLFTPPRRNNLSNLSTSEE